MVLQYENYKKNVPCIVIFEEIIILEKMYFTKIVHNSIRNKNVKFFPGIPDPVFWSGLQRDKANLTRNYITAFS